MKTSRCSLFVFGLRKNFQPKRNLTPTCPFSYLPFFSHKLLGILKKRRGVFLKPRRVSGKRRGRFLILSQKDTFPIARTLSAHRHKKRIFSGVADYAFLRGKEFATSLRIFRQLGICFSSLRMGMS